MQMLHVLLKCAFMLLLMQCNVYADAAINVAANAVAAYADAACFIDMCIVQLL